MILVWIIIALYSFTIIILSLKWIQLKTFRQIDNEPEIFFSIVIPSRNEENNILKCLKGLIAQNYPVHLFEIIVVNDHSDDNTLSIAQNFISSNPSSSIRILSPRKEMNFEGKKQAIDAAVSASKGEYIITTDADCLHDDSYLLTLNSFIQKHNPNMICGPVRFEDGNGFFNQFLQMEFSGLIGAGAGSIALQKPIMSNGANLIFRRESFYAVNSYEGTYRYSSGEDISLMMKFKKKFGAQSIHFLKSANCMVNTPAANSLGEFMQQRLRWVSKSKAYSDPFQLFVSFIVFAINIAIVITLFGTLLGFDSFLEFLIFFGVKIVADLPLFIFNRRFFRLRTKYWHYPINQLVNALYTSLIGVLGQFNLSRWKGRKLINK